MDYLYKYQNYKNLYKQLSGSMLSSFTCVCVSFNEVSNPIDIKLTDDGKTATCQFLTPSELKQQFSGIDGVENSIRLRPSQAFVINNNIITQGKVYYEIEILKLDDNGMLDIGFVPDGIQLVNDTYLAANSYFETLSYKLGQIQVGDKIGCLLNLNTVTIKYYKNGSRLHNYTEFSKVSGPLRVAVMLTSPITITLVENPIIPE